MMNEREKLMYGIISNISETNAPIVFKGALITKLILQESGFKQIERATKDIDANWIGTPPTMDNLVDTINQSLGELGKSFLAVSSREYGDTKSAGVSILEKETMDEILSMDIDIKPVADSRIYYHGEAAIKGVLANEILVDKITACSSDAVYKWRTKDLIDVFALSHCIQVNTQEIYNVSEKVKRKIQSFDAFYGRRQDLKHSYDKLKGIEGKPDFEKLYAYLSQFFKPFANHERMEKIWDSKSVSWNEREKKMSMSDWKNLINNEKKGNPISKQSGGMNRVIKEKTDR